MIKPDVPERYMGNRKVQIVQTTIEDKPFYYAQAEEMGKDFQEFECDTGPHKPIRIYHRVNMEFIERCNRAAIGLTDKEINPSDLEKFLFSL